MTIHSKSKYLCIQRTNLFLEYYTHTQWLLLLLFEHYRIIAKNKNNCRQQWSVSSQLNTSNQWNPGDWWKQWADGNIISCPQPQGDKAGQQVEWILKIGSLLSTPRGRQKIFWKQFQHIWDILAEDETVVAVLQLLRTYI